MITFSIITVTYNAAQCLERTVLSVLRQSYPHIEFLIIDGGSTDGTVDIIKQYADGIAYWTSEKDNGLYDAMNKGLRQATGNYVWFLNAGDTLHTSNTLQEIAVSLKKRLYLPDVIYGDTQIADADGNSLGLRRLRPPARLTWKSFRMGMLVCHQSFVAKREIAPFFDEEYKLVADYDWCIRCLKRARKIKNTQMILSDYLEAGLSSVHRKASLKERYKVMCKYYGTVTTVLLHGWFAVRFYTAKFITGRALE
ncbi:MAG: glycosyltransferase [Tannerellaceae bacterium]|jgi:glycosyltransferase involved in cell wall biosynthesis|nr:glycosyltransferase [Tannerellaceae bacterium]